MTSRGFVCFWYNLRILGALIFWDANFFSPKKSRIENLGGVSKYLFVSYLVSGEDFYPVLTCCVCFSKMGRVFQPPNNHNAWEKVAAVLQDGPFAVFKGDKNNSFFRRFFFFHPQWNPFTVFSAIYTWNPKQPFINGCFNWMIPNLYIGNGCFTKHPFINGCLGFQVRIKIQESPFIAGSWGPSCYSRCQPFADRSSYLGLCVG